MATEDEYRAIAFALPGVIEEPYYGSPSFKVGRKYLSSIKDDGETIVVRLSFEQREFCLATEPDVFFVTPHYRNWAGVLVRLAAVDRERLAEILQDAWDFVATLPEPRRSRPRK